MSAIVNRAKVTGNITFATNLLPELIKFYDDWSDQFNSQLGLYWQTPLFDAMEYSASSYRMKKYGVREGYCDRIFTILTNNKENTVCSLCFLKNCLTFLKPPY